MKHIIKIIKSKGKILSVVLALATLVLIIVTLVLSRHDLRSAKKNAKYTIAYITSDWHQKNNNGVGTDFTYEVNGHQIGKTCANNLKKGTRYIVLYDSISPKNYIMLYNHQLSSTVKAPRNGWEFSNLPIKVDSADLKFYFEKLNL
ncbi:hypothetical protein [Chryseobacterium vrystaatense]|uniref:DUF3592 domain-containing protein n=1 Tax=Chryseobacterium vrystaatense TaxID=307480 RepID=A0A1M5DWY3_9FLAO|nr:hypothetical protein [Chryseobacterium vrystaatense]SHF71469.1 hypothetical protein SAMN02787073_2742 [Chryseobacterium vrystaatense]